MVQNSLLFLMVFDHHILPKLVKILGRGNEFFFNFNSIELLINLEKIM